jgi:hypothetical protein
METTDQSYDEKPNDRHPPHGFVAEVVLERVMPMQGLHGETHKVAHYVLDQEAELQLIETEPAV